MEFSWDTFLKALNKYVVMIPIIFAVVPFTIAFLATLHFTMGNPQEAAYIIQSIGIVNIWVQGLAIALTILADVGLCCLFLWTLTQIKRHPLIISAFALILLYLVMTVVPIIDDFVFIIVGSVLAIVTYFSNKKIRKKHTQQLEDMKHSTKEQVDEVIAGLRAEIKKDREIILLLLSLIVLSSLFAAIITFPYAPESRLTDQSGKVTDGKVLSRSEQNVLFLDNSSYKLKLVATNSIRAEAVCNQYPALAYTKSVIGYLTSTQRIEDCPDK